MIDKVIIPTIKEDVTLFISTAPKNTVALSKIEYTLHGNFVTQTV